MEFGLLQEDIFQKQLWDITAFTNAISSCDKIGTVASMTKLAIHLHTPQFKYMSAYYVRWLLIDKKTPQYIEPPESVTDNCTSLTHFLREHTLKENNVSFRSIHWSQNLVSSHNYAPLLVTLLTDGTVLFVDTCSKTAMQTAFGVDYVPTTAGSDQTHTLTYLEDSSYSVKLRECSISLDCATTYKQYCHKEGLHLFQYRIRSIADHHLAQSGANLMCFAACDRVTIWQVYHNAAGELQIELLIVCLIPGCGVDTSVTAVLATTLSTTATSCAVAVVCGTNEGDLVTFELKLTQDSANSVAVGPVYEPAAVTSRLAGRVKVSDAPIDRVQLSAMTDSTVDIFVGAEKHSVSIAALLSSPTSSTGVTASTRLFPIGSVSAFELLPDLRALTSTDDSVTASTNTTVPTGVLTSSTTGILSTWTVTPTPTTSSTNNLHLLEENILNKAKTYPIIGVTSDPTKLVYTYLYKTPAMHSNSREVQLNIALRNPRTALAVGVSPFVVQDFAASVLHTAQVLLYVVHAQSVNNTATVKMPLSGLVLAYLQSLETESCKQYYRTLIANLPHDELSTTTNNTPADKSKRKRSNNSANSSDSSENESENEESDIEETASTQQPKQTIFLHKDQQLQKLQQQQNQAKSSHGDSDSEDSSQPRSAAKSGQKKKFLASQTRVRNTAKLYNRIEQLARPGSMEVVTLAIGTVFDAAVCVAYSTSNNNNRTSGNTGSTSSQAKASGVSMDILSAVDTGVCDVVKEMDLGDKIEILFSLPTEDTIALELKRTLWQGLHVLLLASHRVRCVSRIGADWEDVPASLRQIMHTAYCFQALRRWLAGTDEATPSSDLQSVYFMSRVLDTDSAAPEAKALALAVQLQLLTYTTSSRGSNSSNSSDSAVLYSLYGAEECGICGCLVDFQPTNDSSDEIESPAQKTGPENTVCGASVLYGTCQGCSIRTERCCFSLRLLTTPAHQCVSSSTANGNGSSSASHSGIVGTQENRVYACPVCTAATSVCLVRTVTAPNSVLRGTTPQALLCPHCAVLMQPL